MKNKEILKWISSSIKGKKHYLVILSLIQVGLGLLSVFFAYMLKFVTAGLENKDKAYFLNSVYILLGIAALIILLNSLYRFLFEYASSSIENSFKKNLFESLLYSPYKMVRNEHKEDWINRLSEDTKIVANNILSIVPILGRLVVQLVAAFVLIIYISPLFGLILLPISVVLLLLTYILRKRLKRYHNDVLENEGRYKIFLSESLEGLSIIHSFVKEDTIKEIGKERLEDYKKARIRRNNFSIICSLGFLFLYYGSYLFGIIFCGLKILTGEMDIPSLTSIIALLTEIQAPIGNITSILPRYYSMLASGERLYLKEKEEHVKEYSLEEIEKKYSSLERIAIKDISFSYLPERKVLSSFSLDIKKNDHLALLGHSGKGKTTLFRLLLSLYPLDEGEIKMIYSQKEENLSKEDRNFFSYIPQENLLLKGSIKENVTFFAKDVDEERLARAYSLSCSDEFISSLEKKDLTLLNEHGGGLSLGQIQRLSIARAIYSDKPILLLDEVTSSLDKKTASKLLENIFSIKDKTIILITHHDEDLPKDVKRIEIGD